MVAVEAQVIEIVVVIAHPNIFSSCFPFPTNRWRSWEAILVVVQADLAFQKFQEAPEVCQEDQEEHQDHQRR